MIISNTVKSPTLASSLIKPQGGLFGTTPNTSTVNGPKYSPPPVIPGAVSAPKTPTTSTPISTVQSPKVNPQPQPLAVAPTSTPTYTLPSGITTNDPNYSGVPSNSVAGMTGTVNGLFPTVTASLANRANTPNEQYLEGLKRYGELSKEIADVGQKAAKAEAGYATTGTTPVAEGNAAVIARTQAAQQAALGQEQQAALTGAGLGQSQQTLEQNALATAAGLAKPTPAAYGQTVFNPVTGEYSGGGGLPADVLDQYATMAANGQISAVPSFITSNPVLNAQLNAAAKAKNPNYNPITSAAQGNVQATIPALETANTAAEGIKNKITSFLDANPALNASDLALANAAQQWIQGKQLTDPKYQTLFNYLSEYTNTLAPILGVGGDPTNLKTEIAQGFINGVASGASIKEVLNNMSQLATGKIQDLKSGSTGGGTVSNPITTAPTSQNNSGWGWNP